MPISAAFTVNGSSVVQANSVAYASTVNLALTSLTGVNTIAWSIASTSKSGVVAPTITLAGSPTGATASFSMPADPGDGLGRAFIVQCVVTGGGATATHRAVVGAENDNGIVPICVDEELERNATHGWGEDLNEFLATSYNASAVAITGGTISGAVNRVASSVSEDVASAGTSANIDIAIPESTSVSHVVQVRAEDASGHWTTSRANIETRRSGSSAPVTSGPVDAFEYISSGTGVTINASISSNNLRINVTNGMGADCHMTIRVWQVESDTTVEDS